MNTYGRYPLVVSHGKGCKLYTSDGKEFLDFTAGIATCILGHSHPVLSKAVSDQMAQVKPIPHHHRHHDHHHHYFTAGASLQ